MRAKDCNLKIAERFLTNYAGQKQKGLLTDRPTDKPMDGRKDGYILLEIFVDTSKNF